MKHNALKPVLNVSGVLFLLTVFCSLPSDYFQDMYPEYYDIEAVTSASNRIKVTGGKAYKSHAILETYHKDSYDRHFIAYGISDLYNDTLIMADTPRVHICTLFNLNANTTYNFMFRGEYSKDPIKENHTITGSFKTVPSYSTHRSNQNLNQ